MTADSVLDDQIGAMSRSSEFWDGRALSMPVAFASRRSQCCSARWRSQNGLSVFEATLMSARSSAAPARWSASSFSASHRAVADRAVDLRRQFPPCALFGRARPPVRALAVWQQAIGFFLLTDPQFALKRSEQGGERGKVGFRLVHGHGAPIYVLWVLGSWIGAACSAISFPTPHALGHRLPAADLFPRLVMGFRKRPLWLPVVLVSGVASISPTNMSARPGTSRSARGGCPARRDRGPLPSRPDEDGR
jgi:predicted branched-subunit amino acid permease